ncbi:hypothetical protein GCM10022289_20720 [Pedobacter jeongneungensis]|uniref:Uncharacterized protein n=1 Tax=Pedobacter jeongneungensis TaxID=947309 RepID=A0ABP8BDM2_9SPHI
MPRNDDFSIEISNDKKCNDVEKSNQIDLSIPLRFSLDDGLMEVNRIITRLGSCLHEPTVLSLRLKKQLSNLSGMRKNLNQE